MPKRVSLIFLGLFLLVGSLGVSACGNDGQLLVHEPKTSAPATVTPVQDE